MGELDAREVSKLHKAVANMAEGLLMAWVLTEGVNLQALASEAEDAIDILVVECLHVEGWSGVVVVRDWSRVRGEKRQVVETRVVI